ncbi:MAG: peroxiredoxin-like family protein [Sphingomonadaceae bacterium]
MNTEGSLAGELAHVRRARAHWEPAYDRMVAGLSASGAGAAAPALGERFPDVSLPDSAGRWTRMADLVGRGPIVLSVHRGGWCPYCRAEMAAWRKALPSLASAGAQLVLMTPETGGRAERLRETVGPDPVILCDVDHGVAMALGLAVPLPQELQRSYRDAGLDLNRLTGGAGEFVPIPATFLIDRHGIVRFAHAEIDFRKRAEPADVLAALSLLRG